MNILFVLYGDFTTNTANPIVLFSKELQRQGHECVIAVPSGIHSVEAHNSSSFTPILYSEILGNEGKIFSNGTRADVVHACTLRIGVVEFLQNYLARYPTPLIAYLEDNETWIVEAYLGVSSHELRKIPPIELSKKIPSALSNPFEYPYILALADFVILIQEKLRVEVPLFIPSKAIPWGVDQSVFHPNISPSTKWRELLQIKNDEKIIVYHGGLNGFTRSAMMDLCKAIELINLAGVPCKLVRTGVNPINFWNELDPKSKNFIVEAGVIDKNELPSILSLADIYVQPGRINPFEDLRLPSKLPEFLSMGKPVLLPNVNIADLFEDGLNAVILQTGEPQEIAKQCLSLFQDKEYCSRMGIAARIFAQKYFEISKQTAELISAYKEAIGSFNANQTKSLWMSLKSDGAMGAALKKINYLLEESVVDKTLIAKQLLKWCEQSNFQVKTLDKIYVDLKQMTGQPIMPVNKIELSGYFKKLMNLLKHSLK